MPVHDPEDPRNPMVFAPARTKQEREERMDILLARVNLQLGHLAAAGSLDRAVSTSYEPQEEADDDDGVLAPAVSSGGRTARLEKLLRALRDDRALGSVNGDPSSARHGIQTSFKILSETRTRVDNVKKVLDAVVALRGEETIPKSTVMRLAFALGLKTIEDLLPDDFEPTEAEETEEEGEDGPEDQE